MKTKLITLPLIAFACSLFTGCTSEQEIVAAEPLSPVRIHQDVEFCIIRPSENGGFASVIVSLPPNDPFPDAPTTAWNSAYGKENQMTSKFLGSEGTKDFYEIDTHIAGEIDQIYEISYEGSEIIVRRNEDQVMLLRPSNQKAEPVGI